MADIHDADAWTGDSPLSSGVSTVNTEEGFNEAVRVSAARQSEGAGESTATRESKADPAAQINASSETIKRAVAEADPTSRSILDGLTEETSDVSNPEHAALLDVAKSLSAELQETKAENAAHREYQTTRAALGEFDQRVADATSAEDIFGALREVRMRHPAGYEVASNSIDAASLFPEGAFDALWEAVYADTQHTGQADEVVEHEARRILNEEIERQVANIEHALGAQAELDRRQKAREHNEDESAQLIGNYLTNFYGNKATVETVEARANEVFDFAEESLGEDLRATFARSPQEGAKRFARIDQEMREWERSAKTRELHAVILAQEDRNVAAGIETVGPDGVYRSNSHRDFTALLNKELPYREDRVRAALSNQPRYPRTRAGILARNEAIRAEVGSPGIRDIASGFTDEKGRSISADKAIRRAAEAKRR
jgi:hypothetical protein